MLQFQVIQPHIQRQEAVITSRDDAVGETSSPGQERPSYDNVDLAAAPLVGCK